MALLLAVLLLSSHAWTQYPRGGVAPPLAGSTPGQNLRNAAAATQNQMALLRTATEDWSRRIESVNYGGADLQQDVTAIHAHFLDLRAQLNALGWHVLQMGRPAADNAVAELEAGLNIIEELFTFLGEQYDAGTLDHVAIARTVRAFQSAMREWEQELKRNNARLGLMY